MHQALRRRLRPDCYDPDLLRCRIFKLGVPKGPKDTSKGIANLQTSTGSKERKKHSKGEGRGIRSRTQLREPEGALQVLQSSPKQAARACAHLIKNSASGI